MTTAAPSSVASSKPLALGAGLAAPPAPIVRQIPVLQPHRFTVAQVEAMIDNGILSKSDRCELIRGELIDKMTLGDPHMATVKRLNRIFSLAAKNNYVVGVQDAVKLGDSRPEPDITILRFRADFYRSQTPTPADILLLIEVADSTLALDKTIKLDLYAENGIEEFWIANLPDDCIEVLRQPRPQGVYGERRLVHRGDNITPLALPDLTLTADDILGPASSG